MYCPQCGTSNEDNAAFCKSCGMDLKQYREQWSDPSGQTLPADEAGSSDPGAVPSTYPPPYQQQYQQGPPSAPPYQTQAGYSQQGYQQQGYFPPAGYQQQPSQGGYPAHRGPVPNIPSYMAWAIVTLILCFWPTGIVAVVYASKVGNLLAMGDIPGAQEASRKAKTWSWVTFGIGVAWIVIVIIIWIIVAAAAVGTFSTF